MRSFTDTKGRPWGITVTVGLVERIKTLHDGLNLLDIEAAFDKLGQPSLDLCRFIFDLIEPQATPLGIAYPAFADACDGNTLDAAAQALIEAVADFFPRRRRELLRRAATLTRQLDATILDTIERRLADAEQQATTSSPDATTSPEPSDSTPADCPSASS